MRERHRSMEHRHEEGSCVGDGRCQEPGAASGSETNREEEAEPSGGEVRRKPSGGELGLEAAMDGHVRAGWFWVDGV